MSALLARQALYGPILMAAFQARGLPPVWGLAIARQESAYQPAAISMMAGDAARGGSRGLCQMSWKTAVALGFKGEPTDLFDPHVNAALSAELCAQLAKQYKSSPNVLQDVASAYNSGKPFARCPASTKIYVANVLNFADIYKPVADGYVRAQAMAVRHAPP